MFRRAENLLCLSLSCAPFPSLRMNSKKMKVLVLGHTGMLGHMVQGTLSKDPTIDVHTMLFDAADLEPLRFFENDTFDYCINCIGITARHIDEGDSVSVQRAITVNSLFPHRLARYAQEHGVKVVHMSTDGVFSGRCTRITSLRSVVLLLDQALRKKDCSNGFSLSQTALRCRGIRIIYGMV